MDVGYFAGLSDDAVPALVARLDELAPEQRVFLARRLLERTRKRNGDWRSWNRSRALAERVFRGHRAELQRLADPSATPQAEPPTSPRVRLTVVR